MPYALCREELKDFTEAQTTRMIIDSAAWQEVMVPILDELEAERKREGKEMALYGSHLLESVLLYQRVCGLTTYRDARDRLASDKGAEARELLGLNALRRYRNKPGKRVFRLMEGIPSESTISRHTDRFMEWRRAEAYEALFRRLVKEHLEWDEMKEEARTLNLDGTSLLTHYTCPKYDSDTGQIVNDKYVTCFDGGFVGREANASKQGHGWNLVSMTTSTGLALTYRLPVLHASEPDTGVENLADYEAHVLPFLSEADERGITVLSADGGFNKPLLRARARHVGLLENIHVVSHSNKPESKANAAKNDAKRIPLDDPTNANYKNWHANGHREVSCKHGRRATKRVSINEQGRVVSRVEGQCDQCGDVTITSGQWRRVQNLDRFVRAAPSDPPESRDWQLGNPLTFNSREAQEYGVRRFWHNEGFHGALVSRFGLIKTKRWFRRRDQARIDVAMVFSIQHAIAMEQRRRLRAAQAQGPPLAAAA